MGPRVIWYSLLEVTVIERLEPGTLLRVSFSFQIPLQASGEREHDEAAPAAIASNVDHRAVVFKAFASPIRT
jgi:hypothetical protein